MCGRDFLAEYRKAVVIAQNAIMDSLARTQSKSYPYKASEHRYKIGLNTRNSLMLVNSLPG